MSDPSPASATSGVGSARAGLGRLVAIPPDVRRDLVEVLSLFVALRVVLGIFGYLMWFTHQIAGPCHFEMALVGWNVFPPIDDQGLAFPLVGVWQRWDACWYTNIAANGYVMKDAVSFWPLFPALTSFAGELLGGDMALGGLVVNAGAYVLAMFGLLRLVRLDFGRRVASRTILFVSVFPAAFFLFAPFTEAVFMATTIWAIYGARRRLWVLAGMAALLAGFSRIQGVFLILPLGWEALRFWWQRGLGEVDDAEVGESGGRPERARKRAGPSDGSDASDGWSRAAIRAQGSRFSGRLRRWQVPGWIDLIAPGVAVILPLVSFTAFIWWSGHTTGQTPFNAQDSWGGNNFHAPWETLQVAWNWSFEHNSVVELLDVFVLALFLVGVIVGLFRLPVSYSLFALPQVLLVSLRIQPTPLTSTLRLMLVVFPVFVLLALACRNRRLERAWLLLSLVLLTYLVSLYLKGDFVA